MERFKFLLKVSFRNLFRQKRRNIFLGIGIALGILILFIVSSYVTGLKDLVFNRFIAYAYGHIQITISKGDASSVFSESGGTGAVIPDKNYLNTIVTNNIKDIKYIREDVSFFSRAIGNGRSDFMAIVGMKSDKGWFESLNVTAGNVYDFTNAKIENPIIIGANKADYLKVKVGDQLKTRLSTKTGQQETARFTVVAIVKNANELMDVAGFTLPENVKNLLNYSANETGSIVVVLKQPLMAIPEANLLHKIMTPPLALVDGTAVKGNYQNKTYIFSFWDDVNKIGKLTNMITITKGTVSNAVSKNGVMVSTVLAEKLSLKPGDKFKNIYPLRLNPKGYQTNEYTVDAVFDPKGQVPESSILLGGKAFYDHFYENLPDVSKADKAVLPGTNSSIYSILTPEYRLLDRSPTSADYTKKYKDLKKVKWYGNNLDIVTMYELADSFIKLLGILELIVFVAVMIIFGVISIGVFNTIRMTIRERTREIGTNRAIGMQQNDVRLSFMIETFFLSLFSMIAGILIGLLAMFGLGFIQFAPTNPLAMLMINRRILFVPNVSSMVIYFLVITLIIQFAAFLPSNKAAKMPVADALRHYD